MNAWQATRARLRFSEIVDEAVAGRPQLIQRRDGKEVVVISRDDYEKTRTNLKSYLLSDAYAGIGEDGFDAIMQDVRSTSGSMVAPRQPDEPD